MVDRELRLERLLNQRARGLDGRVVGPLEEVHVEKRDGRWRIVEYHIGAYGLPQRLAGSSLGQSHYGP